MLMFFVVLIISLCVYLNVGFLLGDYLWKIAHRAPTNFSQAIFNNSFLSKDPYKEYASYETKPNILAWNQGQYAAAMAFGWGVMFIAHIILFCLIVVIAVVIDLGVLILNPVTWPVRKAFKLKSIPFFNPFK